jgi:hypothetical protein
VTFTNLSHTVATNITIAFTSGDAEQCDLRHDRCKPSRSQPVSTPDAAFIDCYRGCGRSRNNRLFASRINSETYVARTVPRW